MAASKVKNVTNVNWSVAGSVVVGMALFGAGMWALSMVPSNTLTNPVKNAAGNIGSRV